MGLSLEHPGCERPSGHQYRDVKWSSGRGVTWEVNSVLRSPARLHQLLSWVTAGVRANPRSAKHWQSHFPEPQFTPL